MVRSHSRALTLEGKIMSDSKELLPYQERVVTESIELEEKIIKLTSFLVDKVGELSQIDAELLRCQLNAMETYNLILHSRISRF